MTEDNEATPHEEQPENPPDQGEPDELGDPGKKALVAERERAGKAERELKALQAQLAEIEAAKLSDLEKAQKSASDAQAERDAAKAESLRLRVAAKHGIGDEDADLFLTGTDEETLTRQAARLAERDSAKRQVSTAPNLGANPEPTITGDWLRDQIVRT